MKLFRAKDLTGSIFGRWKVLGFSHKINQRYYWDCVCECGEKKSVDAIELKRGSSKSCGCLRKELISKRSKEMNTKHGMSRDRIYNIYKSIVSRCNSDFFIGKKYYKDRGIKNEFLSLLDFKEWALNNGYKDDLTIERIDNDGNYSRANCKWVTPKQQGRNKRNNVILEVDGVKKCLSEWSEISGIHATVIKNRIKSDWDVKDAIFRKPSRLNRKNNYAAIEAVKAYGMGDGTEFFKLHGEVGK